jgi:hypothetical protein
MTAPMKLLKKLVLVLALLVPAWSAAQNVTIGDTVWYVNYGYFIGTLESTSHKILTAL